MDQLTERQKKIRYMYRKHVLPKEVNLLMEHFSAQDEREWAMYEAQYSQIH